MPAFGEWGTLASNALAIVLVLVAAFVWFPNLINKVIPNILKQRSEEVDDILEHSRQQAVRDEARFKETMAAMEIRHAEHIARSESRTDTMIKLWNENADARVGTIVEIVRHELAKGLKGHVQN